MDPVGFARCLLMQIRWQVSWVSAVRYILRNVGQRRERETRPTVDLAVFTPSYENLLKPDARSVRIYPQR